MAWTEITDAETGDIVTAEHLNALRDNAIAIAEGDVGAPRLAKRIPFMDSPTILNNTINYVHRYINPDGFLANYFVVYGAEANGMDIREFVFEIGKIQKINPAGQIIVNSSRLPVTGVAANLTMSVWGYQHGDIT